MNIQMDNLATSFNFPSSLMLSTEDKLKNQNDFTFEASPKPLYRYTPSSPGARNHVHISIYD